jgi:hypothetical protein
MTLQALVDSIIGPTQTPSHDAVEQEYSENVDAMKALGSIPGRYRILLELEANRRTAVLQSYLSKFRADATVETFLRTPSYDLTLHPTHCRLGTPGSPAQLVVFLDYECPSAASSNPS